MWLSASQRKHTCNLFLKPRNPLWLQNKQIKYETMMSVGAKVTPNITVLFCCSELKSLSWDIPEKPFYIKITVTKASGLYSKLSKCFIYNPFSIYLSWISWITCDPTGFYSICINTLHTSLAYIIWAFEEVTLPETYWMKERHLS